MSLHSDPRQLLHQLVADVRHRYEDDEAIYTVMANLMGAICWGSADVATLQNIVTAIWDHADESTRQNLMDGAEREHVAICACCRANAEQRQTLIDWQKAQVA